MFIFMALSSIVYRADLHPWKCLFGVLFEVLAYAIGAIYTKTFYSDFRTDQLGKRIIFTVFVAILSLTCSLLNHSFQVFLFFASF